MSNETDSSTPVNWQPAPLHHRESERLASLRDLQLLGTNPEPGYDRLCGLARTFLDAPVALIALIDEDFSYFKACAGADLPGIPKDDGPCGYTILGKDALVIPDMAADPKFAACPVATSSLAVRFYAGIPLFDENDLPLGTLCILDQSPRTPDAAWVASLTSLAAIVEDELALTRSNRRIQSAYAQLQDSEEQYTSLVSTVPGVVFRCMKPCSGAFRVTFMSNGIHDLCGLYGEEYVRLSESGGTMIHAEDRESFAQAFEESALSIEPLQWQGRIDATYGVTRWIQVVARPEFQRNGDVHWSGIVTDIDALKAAEGEILETNRTLESKVVERTEDLLRAQIEMLNRLGKAAEARDDDTGAHISRVAEVSGILAQAMEMSRVECEMIRQASPMHDIGKISVPDAILLKPGRLTEDEFETMRSHAIEGSRMLEGGTTALVQMAEAIARTHHERWDGSGYPHGIKGEEIPLVGRIVAVADVFDALLSERPYKRAWSVDEAVREIARGAGAHFDPGVVDAFLATLPEVLLAMGRAPLQRAA